MEERRSGSWEVVHEYATASDLHGRDLPEDRRSIHVIEVAHTAIVLGSTQAITDVDVDRAAVQRVEVVRRRSGGGAVLLMPGGQLWIDVVVPRDDSLWDDDVARAAHWLGGVWARALDAIGHGPAEVHRGPMVTTSLSSVICFAGLGPGEVTVDGRKVVGVSQRRTRGAARFQCAVPGMWDRELTHELLAPGIARMGADGSAIAVGTVDALEDLLDAFVESLPR